MVDSRVPVIAVVSGGPGGQAAVSRGGPAARRRRGCAAGRGAAGPDGLLVDADGLSEDLLPMLEILPLQQLAWRLAVDRGQDPDRPRGLAKVTMTR